MIFKVGSLVACKYTRFHHDPNPVLLVLRSDVMYTEGINVHYIGSIQLIQFTNMIKKLHTAGMSYSGELLYATIKRYVPQVLGRGMAYRGPRGGVTHPRYNAYRKYFTMFLTGVEVHPGVNKFPNRMFSLYQAAMEKMLQNSVLKQKAQRDTYIMNMLGTLPKRQTLVDSMKEQASRFGHLFRNDAVINQQNQNLQNQNRVNPNAPNQPITPTGPVQPNNNNQGQQQ